MKKIQATISVNSFFVFFKKGKMWYTSKDLWRFWRRVLWMKIVKENEDFVLNIASWFAWYFVGKIAIWSKRGFHIKKQKFRVIIPNVYKSVLQVQCQKYWGTKIVMIGEASSRVDSTKQWLVRVEFISHQVEYKENSGGLLHCV